MSRANQILIAVDQLINVIAGGYADETMSARCWRLRQFQPYTTLQRLIDRVFFWQLDHCRTSYESEVQRKQLPSIYHSPTPNP